MVVSFPAMPTDPSNSEQMDSTSSCTNSGKPPDGGGGEEEPSTPLPDNINSKSDKTLQGS